MGLQGWVPAPSLSPWRMEMEMVYAAECPHRATLDPIYESLCPTVRSPGQCV